MQDRRRDGLHRVPYEEAVRLTGILDDPADPTTMTVVPTYHADVTTTWLSVDVDAVVDLRDAV